MVGRKNEKIIYSADQLVFGLFLGANTKTMTTTAVLLSDDGLHFATTSITQPDPWGGEGDDSWEEWGVDKERR